MFDMILKIIIEVTLDLLNETVLSILTLLSIIRIITVLFIFMPFLIILLILILMNNCLIIWNKPNFLMFIFRCFLMTITYLTE